MYDRPSLSYLKNEISCRAGINAHTEIHAANGIRTHDLSIRASEDSSCLRPPRHFDLRVVFLVSFISVSTHSV
jgi:hypothetical protein